MLILVFWLAGGFPGNCVCLLVVILSDSEANETWASRKPNGNSKIHLRSSWKGKKSEYLDNIFSNDNRMRPPKFSTKTCNCKLHYVYSRPLPVVLANSKKMLDEIRLI